MKQIITAFIAAALVCANLAWAQTVRSTAPAAGQIPGTTTNDSASAGNVGQIITSGPCFQSGVTATITITIASPGVITWTTHGMTGACPVVFTTTGALPTGITAGTTYWIVPSSVTANTFQIATTIANALAGTSINTSGTQSGTQTGTAGLALTNGSQLDITGVSLTAGDWDCTGTVATSPAGTTTQSNLVGWLSTTSATLPATGFVGGSLFVSRIAVGAGLSQSWPVGRTQFSLSATTTVYLSMISGFAVSTNVGAGQINCRRVR